MSKCWCAGMSSSSVCSRWRGSLRIRTWMASCAKWRGMRTWTGKAAGIRCPGSMSAGSVGAGNGGGSGYPHGPRADRDARQSAAETQRADISAASPGDSAGSTKSGRQDPDSPAAERARSREALAGSVRARGQRRWAMNTPIERLQTALETLGLKAVEARLENLLEQASKKEPSYADFLDELLNCEVEARRTRYLRARLQLAHFPFVKTFEQFDFGFQPSLDDRQ